jgi:hypothetical protein
MPFALASKQASLHRELPRRFGISLSGRHWRVTRIVKPRPVLKRKFALDFDPYLLGLPIVCTQELPCHHQAYEDRAMAKDEEPFESVTVTAAQTAKQITEQTQEVMENYFGWLQKTMPALPWSNTNLNRILLNHATQNVTAAFAFVQKLSQAKNFQDVVKIQTEFMETQMTSFNEQAKILGEVYTKAAEDVMKTSLGVSR